MNKNQELYVLRPQTLGRVRSRNQGAEVCCERCRQALRPGEVVLRKLSSGKARYYHAECWESMLIEA